MFFPVAARLVWGTEGLRLNTLSDIPAELLRSKPLRGLGIADVGVTDEAELPPQTRR